MTKRESQQNWVDTLPPPLRDEVLGRMSVRELANGELIYRAGDAADEMYQVVEGAVRIYTLTQDGRELLYDLFPAGACLGEAPLIDDQPRPHMTQAVGAVKLRVLPRADFLELWRAHPAFSLAVARTLCQRSRRLYEIYEGVSLAALSRRMAGRLCALAETVGQAGDDGIHFNIRITQEDIGSLVAGSRQSVNRILRQWQCRGVIDIAYGSLVIRNLPTLERLAAGNE